MVPRYLPATRVTDYRGPVHARPRFLAALGFPEAFEVVTSYAAVFLRRGTPASHYLCDNFITEYLKTSASRATVLPYRLGQQ